MTTRKTTKPKNSASAHPRDADATGESLAGPSTPSSSGRRHAVVRPEAVTAAPRTPECLWTSSSVSNAKVDRDRRFFSVVARRYRVLRATEGITHLDSGGRPSLVDVGAKNVTSREAIARARVWLPPAVLEALEGDEIRSPKGPVFSSAILAGTMAAKRTPDLIPLCHPLPLDRIRLTVSMNASLAVIRCEVSTDARTGVEMEALTGASVAALTIYDMCKALSPNIVIEDIRLVRKRGGRHDFDLRE